MNIEFIAIGSEQTKKATENLEKQVREEIKSWSKKDNKDD